MKMGGHGSPFGVDHDRVPALIDRLVAAGADWHGLHIYAGSQALSADAVIELQRETIALAASIADRPATLRATSTSAAGSASPISPRISRSISTRSEARSARP